METTPGDLTILGRGARFEGGKLNVEGDLRVDGEVDVDELVVGERMIVTASGNVQANMVRAREAVVAGLVNATVRVNEVLILKDTGHTKGSITAARLIVEEGGVCDGMFSIGKGDEARPAAPMSPPPAAAAGGKPFGGPGMRREGARPVQKSAEESSEDDGGSPSPGDPTRRDR